jgi:hypothetical protein
MVAVSLAVPAILRTIIAPGEVPEACIFLRYGNGGKHEFGGFGISHYREEFFFGREA